MFKKIAVIGLGLLGGSVCKSLKKKNPEIEITAYGRDLSRLSGALSDHVVDKIDLLDRIILKDVDLIIIATPVISSINIIKEILNNPELESGTLVIDVGSVKGPVVKAVAEENHVDQIPAKN